MRTCKKCSLYSRAFNICRLTKMKVDGWMSCTAGALLNLDEDYVRQQVDSLQ